MNANHLPLFEDVDVIQVGARSMQNFELLKKLGRSNKPILIKRGLANAIKELLMSDEYVISGGNENIILCERGCAPLRRLPGTPWTCPPSLSSTSCPTCPSLWTPATPPALPGTSRLWPWPPPCTCEGVLRPAAHLAAVHSGFFGERQDRRGPARGEKLVGTFTQPRLVLCDTDALKPLSPADTDIK